VDKGYADIGIVGSDVLLEYPDAFYELLDLKIGVCDLCLAAKADFDRSAFSYLRIATKYERQALRYLEKIGMPGEIIKLNGSVELGPLLEISDCIIDIVETGRTLKENHLVVKETLRSVSSRLIANKVSYKLNHRLIDGLITELKPFLEVSA
jgi:ATP phosphoribosyltransferase